MKKQEIQEQIRILADKLNDYSDGLYNYYYNTWLDDDDIFALIDDYSSYLVEVKAYSELIGWFEDCPESVFYIKTCFERDLITSSYDAYMLIGTALSLYYNDKLKEDYTTLKELHRLHKELAELEN